MVQDPQHDSSGLKVVAIGGGTGLSTLLRGLKFHVAAQGAPEPLQPVISNLTAVVCVTDDGGSSGRLRKELGVMPPGDIRNCMTALSEDEPLLSSLFQYRFTSGEGLEGHNFGNLFLSALAAITGDFAAAVKFSSAILKTRGDIFPATISDVQLDAFMNDGTRVRGETNITASKKKIIELRMAPANAKPLPQTLEAIASADLITIGPGSLFTSLVPNLLVTGIPEAIEKSTAVKMFVCNLMTQPNESTDMTASDHVRALFQHAGRKFFDYVLLNGTPIPEEMREKYALEGSEHIPNDFDELRHMGVEPIVGPYLAKGEIARHDAEQISYDLLQLAMRIRSGQHAKMMADAIQN